MVFENFTPPLQVTVLTLPDSNTLSFAAALDPMRAANRLASQSLFKWQFATATGDPAPLTSGISVPGNALSRLPAPDLLILIASFELEQHDTPALRASLRRVAQAGSVIAGVDGGPWLMAAAGLLDGYRACPHWEDHAHFEQSFPQVTALRDRFHIDRDRLTSGGALPTLDMMLSLTETHFGARLATEIAGVLLHDNSPDPARAQTRAPSRTPHTALTARASTLMQARLESPLSIPEIAQQLGVSPRTLEMRFARQLGQSPKSYYLSLRLNEARRLLRDTEMPIYDIALAAGFNAPASFARAFHSAFGQSASSYRRRLR